MERKAYEDLCFTDDFMFCKILSNNHGLCKELLELILGIRIRNLEFAEPQKPIEHTYDGRGIRLDVYVEDDANTVYDIEMQTVLKANLPKRTRYYQGMIDLNLLERGDDFNKLKKSFIVFICLDDPFKAGFPIYTFTNRCMQDPEIELGDASAKVIVNAGGSREGLSEDMVSFLDYLKSRITGSDFTRRIEADVDNAIEHRRWKVEYMTLDMIRREERQEGHEEGFIEGREKGHEEGREEGRIKLLKTLYSMVSDGAISIEYAASQAEMTPEEFEAAIKDYESK